jgi:hypothetical protein
VADSTGTGGTVDVVDVLVDEVVVVLVVLVDVDVLVLVLVEVLVLVDEDEVLVDVDVDVELLVVVELVVVLVDVVVVDATPGTMKRPKPVGKVPTASSVPIDVFVAVSMIGMWPDDAMP